MAITNPTNQKITDRSELSFTNVFDTGYAVRDGVKQPLLASVMAKLQDVNMINESLIFDYKLSTPKTVNEGTAQFEVQPFNSVSNLDPLNPYKQPTITKFQYNIFINQKYQAMLSYDIMTKMTRADWMGSVAKGLTNLKTAAGDATNLLVLDHSVKVGLAYGQFFLLDYVQSESSAANNLE